MQAKVKELDVCLDRDPWVFRKTQGSNTPQHTAKLRTIYVVALIKTEYPVGNKIGRGHKIFHG
ncbi:MAG: hypothetical protein AAFZ49_06995, partial [Cyanobacteria bacterium J06659_2]